MLVAQVLLLPGFHFRSDGVLMVLCSLSHIFLHRALGTAFRFALLVLLFALRSWYCFSLCALVPTCCFTLLVLPLVRLYPHTDSPPCTFYTLFYSRDLHVRSNKLQFQVK